MTRPELTVHYSVILSRDEDGNWVVSVPALIGCHTFGETREEALANAEEAIRGCVESLLATGDPIPEEKDPVELIHVDLALPALA